MATLAERNILSTILILWKKIPGDEVSNQEGGRVMVAYFPPMNCLHFSPTQFTVCVGSWHEPLWFLSRLFLIQPKAFSRSGNFNVVFYIWREGAQKLLTLSTFRSSPKYTQKYFIKVIFSSFKKDFQINIF